MKKTIETLLDEQKVFPPPSNFCQESAAGSNALYEKAIQDPDGFWAEQAEELHWFKKWDTVLQWDAPYAKWFNGGALNASYNCLDRHIKTLRRNKAALIWEGEPGEERVLTYWDLYREVCKFANVLKRLGVKKGDTVTIYMPMIPEAIIAMLACTRIGAPHSVVFGGFSAEALRDRITDAQSKVLITADCGYRRGGLVPLKRNADEALKNCPSIEHVVIYKRMGDIAPIHIQEGRDHWWHRLMEDVEYQCNPEPMDSEDVLYILYTSGSTGKPKGIVHTTGGYLTGVHSTTKHVFNLREEDVFWCTADIGWVTGHSYIVYGPLLNGASVFIYEGAPDYPEKDRFWSLIEKYGITIFYTAPTAIRTFMRWGAAFPEKHDLSSLRLLGTVGEPINPEAWMWYYQTIGRGRCPVVDTWWQTETGMILITPLPDVITLKPGSATKAFPGIEADVVDEEGLSVPCGKGGYLVLKRPWPAMLRTIFRDPDRYIQQYWSKYRNMYFTGDGAKRDSDGYFWLLGRVDDVMNIAGHRISTMEVESAFASHPCVAEAAVIGKSHELKGQAITAFVTVKEGVRSDASLASELKEHIVKKIGSLARPEDIIFSTELPKTRSGKIMRRLLRDIAEGRVLGDTTTLADPAVVADLKERYEE